MVENSVLMSSPFIQLHRMRGFIRAKCKPPLGTPRLQPWSSTEPRRRLNRTVDRSERSQRRSNRMPEEAQKSCQAPCSPPNTPNPSHNPHKTIQISTYAKHESQLPINSIESAKIESVIKIDKAGAYSPGFISLHIKTLKHHNTYFQYFTLEVQT